MNSLFLQVIVSFFVGGIAVTIVSLLAGRMNEKTAGVVMMFPTTAAIGFFFLGIISTPEKVAEVIPITLIPLGMVSLSSFLYIRFANYYHHKINSRFLQIILTLGSTSLVWFLVVFSCTQLGVSSLGAGILGYFTLIVLHQYCRPAQLYYFFRKAPAGSLSIFAYCISVMWLYTSIGLIAATFTAYLISAGVSFLLTRFSVKDTLTSKSVITNSVQIKAVNK